MNLFSETIACSRWIARVTGAFFKVRPWTTLALIIASVGENLTRVLAFFLPLKVILLAGSSGVPRYFRFFIEPDQKVPWIIGLSIGAVVFYVASLLLEAAGRRLAEAGSSEVLQGANEIAVTSVHRDEARSYYARFSAISSGLLLVLLMGLVLAWINWTLFVVLALLVVAQYGLSAAILQYGDPLNPNRVLRMMVNNLSGYLTIFTSINFLTGFFVILIPYLQGSQRNILLAILSILLLRRGLGSLSNVVSTAAVLWQTKVLIDPYIFREARDDNRERSVIRTLRQLFSKPSREERAAEKLGTAGFDTRDVEVVYADFKLKYVYTFDINLPNEGEAGRKFRQLVFSDRQLHLLEHEEFLFRHVGREQLGAALVRARYAEGPFTCEILDCGIGRAVTKKDWPAVSARLLTRLWSFSPPGSLVSAYRTSRSTLEGRLTPEFLERVTIALDYPRQRKIFEQTITMLPDIASILQQVPLHIFNPDLSQAQVIAVDEDDYRILLWQRWAIEHTGVDVPDVINSKMLENVVAEVREARGLSRHELSTDHVRLASHCRKLEQEVTNDNFNRAISIMKSLMVNPLLGVR